MFCIVVGIEYIDFIVVLGWGSVFLIEVKRRDWGEWGCESK